MLILGLLGHAAFWRRPPLRYNKPYFSEGAGGARLPSTTIDLCYDLKMKLAMEFFHTLINVEILILSCALGLSEFCVIL